MADPILSAAPYKECFSWGSRYHCPMEVGAYACPKLWTLKILPRQVGLVIKKTR